jgi:hypothetical protein
MPEREARIRERDRLSIDRRFYQIEVDALVLALDPQRVIGRRRSGWGAAVYNCGSAAKGGSVALAAGNGDALARTYTTTRRSCRVSAPTASERTRCAQGRDVLV